MREKHMFKNKKILSANLKAKIELYKWRMTNMGNMCCEIVKLYYR
jgi:hypothetical protein